MKRIIIRPKDIKNCWETEDACIIEQYDGKRWVCEKYLRLEKNTNNQNDSITSIHIKNHQKEEFVEIHLKGKSE